MNYTSEHLPLNGVSMHLRRAGMGDPILFLHGAAGAVTPLPFLDRIAGNRTVLIPDHPGFGESEIPGWLFGMGDLAYHYLDVLAHLGFQQFDIVGHSIGGWLAAEIAARNATAIRSLTLIAPAGVRVKGVLSGDLFMWSPEERLRNLYFDQSLADTALSPSSSPDLVEQQLKNSYAAARLGWEPRLHNPELQRWLHRIKVPVQLVWGENDRILPIDYAKVWLDALPQARLSRLARCGHLPHVERPSETLSILDSFLREIET